MRIITAACAAAVLALLGSSCSAQEDNSSTHDAPASSEASSQPSTASPSSDGPLVESDVLGDVSDPVVNVEPRGANAAPGAPTAPNPVYDPSQAANDNFIAWFGYEAMESSNFPGKTAEMIYADGAVMCGKLRMGLNPEALMKEASGLKGYTGTGAAALYKAAISALCPWHNMGYQTYFDKSVASMMNAINAKVSWTNGPPPFYDYGHFASEVCAYLKLYQTNGLEEHLVGLQGRYPAGHMMVYANGDKTYMKLFVNHAALAVCPGYHMHLNGYWTMP